MHRLLVTASLVLAAATAAAAPVFSPELPGDAPVDLPAPNTQSTPAVAFDGTNYLVVWADSGGHILGTRLAADGSSIDHGALQISNGPNREMAPAVAFDGQQYLVVWEDTRNQAAGYQRDVYGTRVKTDGTVLDPAGLQIDHGSKDAQVPQVAAGGGAFAVVWQDHDSINPNDVVSGALVYPNGNLYTGIGISNGANRETQPTVAFDGTDFLVAWTDQRSSSLDVYGTRWSTSGTVLDPAGLPLVATSAYEAAPRLACDGTNCLLAWTGAGLQAARVTPAGTRLDATPLTLATTGSSTSKGLAFDGTDYLLAFSASTGTGAAVVQATRVGADGTVRDASPLTVATGGGSRGQVAAAGGNGGWFVTFQDTRSGTARIMGARVAADGSVPDAAGLLLSVVPNSEGPPAVAWDGTHYLVVWSDTRGGSLSHLYGARFDVDGNLLDQPALTLTTGSHSQTSPRVAFDGTNFLVVCQDVIDSPSDSDVWALRVSPGGVVLDPTGIPVVTGTGYQQGPDVAASASGFFVVWADTRGGNRTYGARIRADGTVQDPGGFPITSGTQEVHPRVASDGTGYLVAFADSRNQATSQTDIYAARVAADGTVQDPAGFPVTQASGYDDLPAVAFGAGEYLVTWRGSGYNFYDLFGRTVASDGTPGASFTVSAAPGDQLVPALAFDGTNFAAVWQDWRNNFDPNAFVYGDVYGARVRPTGGTIDSGGLAIAAAPGPIESTPAIAHGPGKRMLVVYDRDQIYGKYPRIRVRTAVFNDAPVAQGQTLSALQDTPIDVTLQATDRDGDALTMRVATAPAHGTLSGTAPHLTYTPASGYSGTDAFTFVANDGSVDSAPATVTLNLTPKNRPPVATTQSLATAEDTAVPVTLAATDADNDPLTYRVVTQPAHGILAGFGANLLYTPAADFNGTDGFTFVANDGQLDSAPAIVTITVTPVNDAPVATPQAVTVAQGATASITLAGTDVDGDALTFAIASPPENGTLSGTPPEVVFTPPDAFQGTTAFTFVANDGTVDSAPATVTVTVTNVAPVVEARADESSVKNGVSVGFHATGSDAGKDPLTYSWDFGDGSASATGADVTHAFAAAGSYVATVTCSDGEASATATVTITVTKPAATGADGGSATPGERKSSGCGCASTDATTGAFWFLAALGLAVRRRRA